MEAFSDVRGMRRNEMARPQDVPRRETAVRGEAVPQRLQTSSLLQKAAALLNRCTARNERLQVCETVSLGGRRSVALLECDGQRFLVGMSAGGVETLVPVPGQAQQGASR